MADPFEIPDGAEDQYEDEDIQSADQAVDRDSIGSGASGYTTPLAKKNAIDAAGSYINALKSSQKTNAEIMQEAQRVLLQRANEGMDAGGWFKIAAALGKPTRTGSFGETLGNVTEVLGSEADKKLKAKRDLEEMQMKYKMQLGAQGADLAKAQMNAYIQTAGIKEPPPSKVRQLQIEASQLPAGSPERIALEKQIEVLNTPKQTKSAAEKKPSERQWALGILRDYNTDPSTVGEKDVELANKVLGFNKPPTPDKRELWTGDEANASIELFGTTDASSQTPPQRAEVRRLAQSIRAQNAAAGRAPKEPKPEKERSVNIDDYKIIAKDLGVPFVASPYASVSDKVASTLLINNTKTAQKTISGFESRAASTGSVDGYVDEFLRANKKSETGRLVGSAPALGTDQQTMENVTAKLAPENRKEGTGSVSDFDAKQLIKGTLSRTNNYETNQRIGQGIKIANQLARDKAQFMSAFFQGNGHLNGAESQWSRYVNANPIFDPSKGDGKFVLNPKRMTYKKFFYPDEARARGGMVGYANGGVVQTVNNYQGYGDLAALRQKYGHGGAVEMQEGGDPIDASQSVVRLPRMAPASDTANRARAFFGQGMGMSFGDEAEALYRSMGQSNRSYDQILNDVRADYRRWSEENPGQSMGYELAGGVAPSVAAMFVPGGQTVSTANATRMARMAPALTKTPLRRAATAGATSGAISGFGAGEGGVGDRLLESGKSAILGGTLGPIIGKGGQLLYGGGKGIYKRLLKPGTDRIEEEALNKVLMKMSQDGLTPQQAIRQVALERGYNPTPNAVGTRPRTKLRDVSPGLTDLAETVANRPGAGRKTMVEDVLKTGRGTKGRTMDIVSENMGKGKTMYETESALTDALKGNAQTLYDDAYKFGTVKDQRILAMMDQPQFKEAYRQVMETNKIRKANAIAKGEDPSKYDMKQVYKITESQPGIYQMDLVDAPDVKTLDQIKRGLDYIIRSGRKSSNAADQDAAHALNEYKNTFLGILDETVPAYKTARQTYKGDLEVLDALDVGRNQYGKFSPEQATDYVSKLTPSERDALRIGYAQQFMDKIGNAKNSINAAEELLGAENNATRLQALFDTPQEYEVFKGILKAESRNVKSGQQIASGSATGRRKELQKEFEGDNVASHMMDLAGGSPFSTFMRLIKKTPDLFKNEQVAASVSKILNTGKPAELNALLKQLEDRANKFAAEQQRLEKIGTVGSKATGRMSGKSPIGADAEEEEMRIPSAVEGGNTGDYSIPEADVEAPEEEPVQEQRRGGRIVRKFDEGGYVIEDPNTLKNILNRVSVSAMGEDMRNQGMKNRFVTGRVGYRQPVGDDAEVGVGLSGLHAKYSGQTPQGQKFSGGKTMVSGVDLSYGDKKNNLYAKYGVPMGGNNMQFSGAGYSRNLDNNRGTVGIQHSTISPEGMPDRRTQLFYSRDFRNGGKV